MFHPDYLSSSKQKITKNTITMQTCVNKPLAAKSKLITGVMYCAPKPRTCQKYPKPNAMLWAVNTVQPGTLSPHCPRHICQLQCNASATCVTKLKFAIKNAQSPCTNPCNTEIGKQDRGIIRCLREYDVGRHYAPMCELGSNMQVRHCRDTLRDDGDDFPARE